ncbi:Nucleoside diphosphate kinase [Capsicum chinense]|nr:Nucleoside diphosphate kinase [Capsicum chinense]
MLLELIINVSGCVLDSPKVVYLWRIRHGYGIKSEESVHCNLDYHTIEQANYVVSLSLLPGENDSTCHHLIFSFLFCFNMLEAHRAFAEKHYANLSAKPFFNGLVEYIVSGPVFVIVWAGKGVVTTGRKITRATNPLESAAGTIRGDCAIDIVRNVIHESDSIESAKKEIALWFPEGVAERQSSLHSWIYE